MKRLLLLMLFASCCTENDYRLTVIEVKYEIGVTDTLRIIAPEGSEFSLRSYNQSHKLVNSHVGDIAYFVKEFNKLN